MFKYVLFDLDGTLTDPKEGICKCVQYALAKSGIEEPDPYKLTPFIGPPLRDSFIEFYGMSDEEATQAIADYRERFNPIGLFENKVYPGIAELLQHLKAAGVILAVASSKPEEPVNRILEHFDLKKYFSIIVGSTPDESRSTKEEVVEETLRRMEGFHGIVNAQSCAMVGDRKFDIIGGHSFGLTAVGVSYGYACPGELEAAGADYIAEDVRQLETYLLGQKENK